MTNYSVELTDAALAAITAQAHYIAVESQAPLNAERWLGRIWDAVDSLEQFPQRAAKAEEDAYAKYEVRRLVIDSHLLLFTIDDDRRKVWIIGLRHGHRRESCLRTRLHSTTQTPDKSCCSSLRRYRRHAMERVNQHAGPPEFLLSSGGNEGVGAAREDGVRAPETRPGRSAKRPPVFAISWTWTPWIFSTS